MTRRRPTQSDVAALAGVSVSTVSYVVSGKTSRKGSFPEATQERVIQAAAQLGYSINQSARSLRRQRSELIGIAYVPPVSPWFDSFSATAQEYFADRNIGLIQIPFSRERTSHIERVLGRGYLDGLLAICPDEESRLVIPLAQKSGTPVTVFSDRIEPGQADVIREFQSDAVQRAVEYLVRDGRRKIAFLDFFSDSAPGPRGDGVSSRQQGYLAGMASAGLTPWVVFTADNRNATFNGAVELLSDAEIPDAIISFSDRGAISLIWAAQQRGIKIPGQIAVIGCGDTADGRYMQPELTSLGHPTQDFEKIFDRLLQRIEDPLLEPALLSLAWKMFIRESA